MVKKTLFLNDNTALINETRITHTNSHILRKCGSIDLSHLFFTKGKDIIHAGGFTKTLQLDHGIVSSTLTFGTILDNLGTTVMRQIELFHQNFFALAILALAVPTACLACGLRLFFPNAKSVEKSHLSKAAVFLLIPFLTVSQRLLASFL